MTARRKKYTLEIIRRSGRPEPVSITVGETADFGSAVVRVSAQRSPGALPMRLPEGAAMTVTVWQPGDWLRLPGRRGPRSFKRLCAERGVSPEQRDTMPVLRVGEAHAVDPVFGVHEDFVPRSGDRTVYVTFYQKKDRGEQL